MGRDAARARIEEEQERKKDRAAFIFATVSILIAVLNRPMLLVWELLVLLLIVLPLMVLSIYSTTDSFDERFRYAYANHRLKRLSKRTRAEAKRYVKERRQR